MLHNATGVEIGRAIGLKLSEAKIRFVQAGAGWLTALAERMDESQHALRRTWESERKCAHVKSRPQIQMTTAARRRP